VSDVRIPKMGMSTVEVEVVTVLVAVGERVTAEQVVVEVEGEKATVEVLAEKAGVVSEVLVAVGDERNVGDVVVRIDEDAV
jgi:pyruvate/2-oxoglutarate dehydrogenase complex dihydrolipoamide acyltransferase (E2) component